MMNEDIGTILKGWKFTPGDLGVRKITGLDGKSKIQIRMDLGLMQLEWNGRPDADRPEGFSTLLEYYQDRRKVGAPSSSFILSRADCWALAQEAMQYYWRRISFFELKEYKNAEEDAMHNISILDMCLEYAEHDEDRQVAEQYRPFVTAHCVQARALAEFRRRPGGDSTRNQGYRRFSIRTRKLRGPGGMPGVAVSARVGTGDRKHSSPQRRGTAECRSPGSRRRREVRACSIVARSIARVAFESSAQSRRDVSLSRPSTPTLPA